MNYKLGLISVLTGLSLLTACKKDEEETPTPAPTSSTVTFSLQHEVDGDALVYNTQWYNHPAGSYTYSVTRLFYYLSDVRLVKADSSTVLLKDFQYVDAEQSQFCSFSASSVPLDDYIGLKFNIGLDSVLNQTDALPATSENQGMEWPVPMGGGYHFMKFEGYYTDTVQHGFAMHLGRNENLVSTAIWQRVAVQSTAVNFTMTMNLNEWFRNPAIYDFNVDGSSSMGSMPAMMKLAMNGPDVFRLN